MLRNVRIKQVDLPIKEAKQVNRVSPELVSSRFKFGKMRSQKKPKKGLNGLSKMKQLKKIGIVQGQVIEENAPIKMAHIVEGESDAELDEIYEAKPKGGKRRKKKQKIEMVGPSLPSNTLYFDFTGRNASEIQDFVDKQEAFIESQNQIVIKNKILKKTTPMGKMMTIIHERDLEDIDELLSDNTLKNMKDPAELRRMSSVPMESENKQEGTRMNAIKLRQKEMLENIARIKNLNKPAPLQIDEQKYFTPSDRQVLITITPAEENSKLNALSPDPINKQA